MGDVLAIPLHLAVHVSGFGLAAGLTAYAIVRRDQLAGGWLALVVGASLLAVSSLVQGAELAEGLAWPLYLRAAGYAGIAFGVAGRVRLAAAAAAVPAASHLVAAVAGGLAAAATAGGVLGRGRQVLPLSGGLALLALGDLVGATRPTLGALLALAGAAAGLTWLVGRARRSLAARFVSLFAGVLLAVVLVLASAAAAVFDQDLQSDRIALLGQQASARVDLLQDDALDGLTVSLEVLAEGNQLAAALADGRASSETAANVARIVTDADLVVLLGPGGGVVGSHDRSSGGPQRPAATALAGLPLVAEARQRLAPTDGLVRIELLATETDAPELLAVSAQPLFPVVNGAERRDRLAGVAVAASRISRRDRLDTIATQTGAQVAMLADGQLAGATVAAGPIDDDLEAFAAESGGLVADLDGRATFVHVEPIPGADGERIGAVVLFEDATVIADLRRVVTRSLFLAAVVGGALATALAAVVTSRTTRPVRRLTEASERIARGDLSVRVDTDRRDEVGRLAAAFGDMATALEGREEDLRESALRESGLRQRLEAVTASMDEALLAVDADGTIGMANPAAARLLAVDRDTLVGQAFTDVVDGRADDGRPLVAALGQPDGRDVRLVRGTLHVGEPTPRAVAATSAPLVDDERAAGRVVVLRDVTWEAEVERLKTEFVSNAAHELRTPLTPVIGYADLLRRHPELEDDRRAAVVDEIVDSAERLREIVDKLIRFADLEAGRARVDPEATDVGDLVDSALEDWRARHPDRSFRRHLRRGLPAVLVDPRWGRMVLDELLDNAVKFSDDTVVVAAEPDGGDRVWLEVRDRGVGIAPEAMVDILTDFRQGDGSATRRYGGLGLGLAIVERVLDRMDADLDIDSHVGQGTHVRVRVPSAPS